MRVTLAAATSYCDGDNVWHEPGETCELPDDEAAALIRGGSARSAEDVTTEKEE